MQNQAKQPPPGLSLSLNTHTHASAVCNTHVSCVDNTCETCLLGYPTENDPPKGNKKMKCWPRTKPRGERGFLEGWYGVEFLFPHIREGDNYIILLII